ncbi:MAG: hypothetical protein HY823_08080 [Acidobacteria bacterium]|nr:hypothetical protein [Acidobacteriota bacterium]
MARVNYARDKRLRDLERQRKQEEKRQRKLHKESGEASSATETSAVEGGPGEGTAPAAGED